MNEPIKLWHDDVRPAPEGWTWARTNEKAMEILKAGNVIAASLDHDLGYEGPPPGECQECHGLGKVWEEKLDSSEPIAFPCAACDGDGFIGGDILYITGTAEETGLDLVKWMVENDRVPPYVTIHSWNPLGARAMAKTIRSAGCRCIIAPYQINKPNNKERERFMARQRQWRAELK